MLCKVSHFSYVETQKQHIRGLAEGMKWHVCSRLSFVRLYLCWAALFQSLSSKSKSCFGYSDLEKPTSGPPPAWRSGSHSHTDALALGMKDQSMFPDVINFVFVGVLFSLPGCGMSLPIVGVALILCLTDCNHSCSPVQCYLRWYIWSLAQCYLSEFQRCPKAKSHRYLCILLCI